MAENPPPRRRQSDRSGYLVISAAAQRSIRFVVALGLIIYEAAFHEGEPRWLLIMLYGTMMGLPIAEVGDEIRRRAMGSDREGVDE